MPMRKHNRTQTNTRALNHLKVLFSSRTGCFQIVHSSCPYTYIILIEIILFACLSSLKIKYPAKVDAQNSLRTDPIHFRPIKGICRCIFSLPVHHEHTAIFCHQITNSIVNQLRSRRYKNSE